MKAVTPAAKTDTVSPQRRLYGACASADEAATGRRTRAAARRRMRGSDRNGRPSTYACSGVAAHASHLLWPCGFSPSPLPLGLNFSVHRPGGPVSTETLQNIALFEKCKTFLPKAREVQASGLHAWYKPISRSEDTVVVIEGKERIIMGSNNYLGLTHHPEVLAAAKAALDRYGSGCTGSRLLNGTLDLHQQLEGELAQFFGKEACVVFSTG